MDLTAMRDYVRAYLDIDQEDLPDALIDPMLNEAAVRVAEKEPHWPWLRDSWTVTLNGASAVAGASVGATGDAVREILVVRPTVVNPTVTSYTYIDHDSALMRNWGAGTEPIYWSVLGDQLYLWPTPNVDTTVLVDGYRKMNMQWTSAGSGAEPDCPEEFHGLFVNWALRGVYLQQDDPETASIWAQEFERGLAAKAADTMRAPAAPPLVMNGDANRSFATNNVYWDV